MNANPAVSLSTSIVKKQILALTGLFQALFVVGHLSGNFLVYAGPDAFNGYAEFLAEKASILWVFRGMLILSFLVHVFFGIRIYLENRAARDQRYSVNATHGMTSFAKKSMIVSGLLVFFFIGLHLADFTFGVKSGAATVIPKGEGGSEYGLFGLVWNSFLLTEYWWRPLIYLCVVIFLGLHLSHGIQSVFQTFGLRQERITPWIERLSVLCGSLIALGFSSIPLYVNILRTP